jgi:simple sugar transport system ATP-binding protein
VTRLGEGRASWEFGRLVVLLELSNISKHFGAIQAVNDISLSLEAGQVVGLMGDNGAGKSTLVKMIAGNFRPSEGTMRLNGSEIVLHRPVEARHFGIEIVHQDLALCDNLTAAANVFLGRELRRGIGPGIGPLGVLDYKAMYRRAAEIFKELRSETRARDLVKQMSGGQRQAVAIARTMISEAKIVLMDEPTAAISVRQVAEVLHLIRQLRDRGILVVLISHRMPDVFDVADRVVVMRRGRKVADKPIIETSPEEVTGLITGAIEGG